MRFRFKIALAMVLLITAAYGAGGTLLISRSFRDSLEREKAAAVNSFCSAVIAIQLVNDVDYQQSFSNISQALKSLQSESGWVYVSLTRDGVPIFENGMETLEMSGMAAEGENATVFRTEDGHYIRINGSLYANGRMVNLSIVSEISGIYETRAAQQTTYRRIFVVLFAVCGLISWCIAFWLTRPLSKMSSVSRRIARGDFSARIGISSNDEVGRLASDFSYMAERLDESMTAMKSELERQERFVGSFAHELKTPMTSIIGYADLIRTQALDEAETMEAANYIFSEGKRLESLSLKLLDILVVKNKGPELSQVNVDSLISSVAAHLRPIYRGMGVRLQHRCEPGTWKMDADLIKSLVVNLLDNARKAMENGGNIYIVSDWPDGNCRIRILDNGRGMPEDVIAHITEAFYREDKSRSRAQGGVGLGLTLCREIADVHNGTISFDSRIGNGTCVTVLFRKEEAR